MQGQPARLKEPHPGGVHTKILSADPIQARNYPEGSGAGRAVQKILTKVNAEPWQYVTLRKPSGRTAAESEYGDAA